MKPLPCQRLPSKGETSTSPLHISRRLAWLTGMFVLTLSPLASAQLGGPGGAGGMPQQQPPGQSKPAGVAEEAPEQAEDTLPVPPVVPPQRTEQAEYQLLTLDGYYRLRGDWFKNFNLGFIDEPDQGGAPFPRPLACSSLAADAPCEETLKSANMRLRLEPVISLRENTTQVFMQIDVLDNVVLGSTPAGFFGDGTAAPGYWPFNSFTESQAAPERGRNAGRDSIRVKRAWAEVETALGRLHFGRMPWHWGVGIYANSGSRDPIHGTYQLDSDYGTTVDRLQFGRRIPGTSFDASIAMDWNSTYPVADQTDFFARENGGQPFDLDDNDDSNQWVFTIMRRDTPQVFAEKLERGNFVWNAGAFMAYKTQSFEQTGVSIGEATDPINFVRRDAKMYIPNLWVRLAKGDWEFELEAVGIVGTIDELSDQVNPDNNNPVTEGLDVRQFGGVARAGYRLLDGDLLLSFEVGYASGDQWDNLPAGRTHVRNARPLPGDGDTTMNQFRFNFNHHVDQILFRELIGTVSNATYLRPRGRWDIGSGFRATGQAVVSFANIPVATPGNGSLYGVELDADFGYESGALFLGISYGVLFPLSALDHPDDAMAGGPGFGFSETNTGDAGSAQTIQTRFVVKF